jgi:hypothetical protein
MVPPAKKEKGTMMSEEQDLYLGHEQDENEERERVESIMDAVRAAESARLARPEVAAGPEPEWATVQCATNKLKDNGLVGRTVSSLANDPAVRESVGCYGGEVTMVSNPSLGMEPMQVGEDYILKGGDLLEFVKVSGVKG